MGLSSCGIGVSVFFPRPGSCKRRRPLSTLFTDMLCLPRWAMREQGAAPQKASEARVALNRTLQDCIGRSKTSQEEASRAAQPQRAKKISSKSSFLRKVPWTPVKPARHNG
jgi:hypothetical protein